MKYKVIIHDRSYTSWSYINEESDKPNETQGILPPPTKLFSKDIILHDPIQNTITTVYSNVRSTHQLAGVLLLEGNRTFGRIKNKLLYKCIPDDKHLPVFLVLPLDCSDHNRSTPPPTTHHSRLRFVPFCFTHFSQFSCQQLLICKPKQISTVPFSVVFHTSFCAPKKKSSRSRIKCLEQTD